MSDRRIKIEGFPDVSNVQTLVTI